MFDEALDKMLAADHDFLSAHEAAAFAGMLERASRKLDALKVAVVDVVDRNGLYAEDGHSSAKRWVAFTCRTSGREARRRVAFAKMFRTLDDTACRYRAGQIGQDQVFELSRAFRNPRCGHQLAESEALLLEHERDLTARQFELAVKHWLSVADAEGIKQRHDSLHQHRDIRITPQFDGGFRSMAPLGQSRAPRSKKSTTAIPKRNDWLTGPPPRSSTATVSPLHCWLGPRRSDGLTRFTRSS